MIDHGKRATLDVAPDPARATVHACPGFRPRTGPNGHPHISPAFETRTS